jgi:hypothetical protein
MACWKNKGAFTVYALGWCALFLLTGVLVTLLFSTLGSAQLAAASMLPVALLLAAMFFSSVYGTFRDCFVVDENPPPLPRVDEIA